MGGRGTEPRGGQGAGGFKLDHYPILNPPFFLAQAFIEKCLNLADWVVCLERLNFVGTQKRGDWLRRRMPDVYVIPDRPSFIRGKKSTTDSIEYAWLAWPPDGRGRSIGWIEILDIGTKMG